MFDGLPTELIITILLDLGVRDILRVSLSKPVLASLQVNHQCRSIIQNSVIIQYLVELYATGNVDGPTSTQQIPVTERLRLLRQHEARQRKLHLNSSYPLDPRRIPLPVPFESADVAHHQTCVLDNGLFVEAVVLEDNDSSIVLLHRFPTHLVSASVKPQFSSKFRFASLPWVIIDFTVIEPCDLLVIIVARPEGLAIQPMSISTLGPHYLARKPVIISTRNRLVNLQAGDSRVGMMHAQDDGFTLDIWDWKLGCLVVSLDITAAECDFVILSDTRFIILSSFDRPLCLNIYDIVPPPTSSASSSSSSPGKSDTVLYASLQLPIDTSYSDFEPGDFGIYLAWNTWHQPIPSAKHAPFSPNKEDMILSFEFHTNILEGDLSSLSTYAFIIRHKSLLDFAVLETASPKAEESPSLHHIVPWEAWGPQSTRLIKWNESSSSVCGTIFGSRYARMVAVGDPEEHNGRIAVFNFSPMVVSRAHHLNKQLDSDGDETMAIFYSPGAHTETSYEGPDAFLDRRVATSLPYMCSITQGQMPFTDIWIDQEHFIAVKSFEAHDFGADVLLTAE